MPTLSGSTSEISPTNTPIRVDSGQDFPNNLSIRFDAVKIRNDDGDNGLGGEVYFAILATRQFGGSAKLVIPGAGTYNGNVGDTINLAKFSLGINNFREREGEKISVYFLAFENDEQGGRNEILTDIALEAVLAVAEDLIPGGSIGRFAVDTLSGQALEWWREVDLLGEYSLVLNKENDWMRGQQYYVQSTNGNLDIYFTIIQSTDIPTEHSEQNVLTVINHSSKSIERLFIAPSNSNSWGEDRLDENLLPGKFRSFVVSAGTYDLRAETSDGLYWESEAVDLSKKKTWTIND